MVKTKDCDILVTRPPAIMLTIEVSSEWRGEGRDCRLHHLSLSLLAIFSMNIYRTSGGRTKNFIKTFFLLLIKLIKSELTTNLKTFHLVFFVKWQNGQCLGVVTQRLEPPHLARTQTIEQ